MEKWLPIKGYERVYQISSYGRICRIAPAQGTKRGRILKTHTNKSGYVVCVLCKDGHQKNYRVHRLIYEAFIKPIPKGMEINHKNGIRNNNQLSNLECLTKQQNVAHSFHTLKRKPNRKNLNRPKNKLGQFYKA